MSVNKTILQSRLLDKYFIKIPASCLSPLIFNAGWIEGGEEALSTTGQSATYMIRLLTIVENQGQKVFFLKQQRFFSVYSQVNNVGSESVASHLRALGQFEKTGFLWYRRKTVFLFNVNFLSHNCRNHFVLVTIKIYIDMSFSELA